jgi:putative sterol carrier protein
MASVEEVKESLESFAADCNANARLKVMNRDWNRIIAIHASDLKRDFTVITNMGSVSVQDGKPAKADMAILAHSEILTQIFYGEVSPNVPYNEGTLRVQGTEQDVLHLDFITAMLWED